MITLVLGGARSGKSRFCETQADHWIAENTSRKRIYVATARSLDDEMHERIKQHQLQRGKKWRTIEEPIALSEVIRREASHDHLILVDCLTLWLTNTLLAKADTNIVVTELCQTLKHIKGEIILVSNEVGLGIVPENKLARQFRDIQGIANQRLAEIADKVILVTAGLPMILKDQSQSPSSTPSYTTAP